MIIEFLIIFSEMWLNKKWEIVACSSQKASNTDREDWVWGKNEFWNVDVWVFFLLEWTICVCLLWIHFDYKKIQWVISCITCVTKYFWLWWKISHICYHSILLLLDKKPTWIFCLIFLIRACFHRRLDDKKSQFAQKSRSQHRNPCQYWETSTALPGWVVNQCRPIFFLRNHGSCSCGVKKILLWRTFSQIFPWHYNTSCFHCGVKTYWVLTLQYFANQSQGDGLSWPKVEATGARTLKSDLSSWLMFPSFLCCWMVHS